MTKRTALPARLALGLLATGVVAIAACNSDVSPVAPSAVTTPQFDKGAATNEKFTFTGVTLVDADSTTYPDAVIEAASKMNSKGNAYTVCSYFTSDSTYLGQFASSEVSFTDPAAAEQFCIDNFAARQ